MKKISRKSAMHIIHSFDRIASLVEEAYPALGFDKRIAKDFARRCDVVSSIIQEHAGVTKKALSEFDPVKENGFDPDDIGREVAGPEVKDRDEAYMDGHFTQQSNRELRERAEAGDLGKSPNLNPQAPQSGKQANRMATAITNLRSAAKVKGHVASDAVTRVMNAANSIQDAITLGYVSTKTANQVIASVNHLASVVGTPSFHNTSILVNKILRLAQDEVDEKIVDEEDDEETGKPKEETTNTAADEDEESEDEDEESEDEEESDETADDESKEEKPEDKPAKTARYGGFKLYM